MAMESKIPKELNDIKDFLTSNPIHLSTTTRDGRINSSINEDEIINYLINNGFSISRPDSRAWFDMAIEERNNFLPINIKVTSTDTADNLNCKLGIYYALTGYYPKFTNEINWLEYFENLHKSFGLKQDKDYFFLIVNKKDNSDIFVTSLKSIRTLQPNGNNLPFQCNWGNNREIISRSFNDAADYIMKVFAESIKARSSIYFNFKSYFPQYV